MVACLESCIAHLIEDEGWISSKPLAAIPASKVGNALTFPHFLLGGVLIKTSLSELTYDLKYGALGIS